MKFAFIGSCEGMTNTGSGTFSYEFRKGQMTDTVTVGFDHMQNSGGMAYLHDWQGMMFTLMDQGVNIKESFDLASAEYPVIAAVVKFVGDENLKIRELVNRAPKEPFFPSPSDNIDGRDIDVDLVWSGGDMDCWEVGPAEDDTVFYDIYFGTSSTSLTKIDTIGPYLGTDDEIIYDPGSLNYDTRYFWKIVARDSHNAETTSSIWNFKTIGYSSDYIDQKNTQWDRLNGITGYIQIAQEFKPTENVLSKISLLLSKTGTPPQDLEVIICDDSSGEPDENNQITSTSLSPGYIDREPSWIEIDFLDVNVDVGETYMIFLKTSGSFNSLNCYRWAYLIGNVYPNGDYWQRIKNLNTNEYEWHSLSIKDGAFKTYSPSNTNYYTLSVSKQGSGSVSPQGGSYADGNMVDLFATPSLGWSFSRWIGDVDDQYSESTFIVMDDDESVTAVFTQNDPTYHTLSVNIQGSGSVTPQGGTYVKDTIVTLTATPDSGCIFSRWEGDVADPNSESTTIIMNADKSVTAFFIQQITKEISLNFHDLTIGSIDADIINDLGKDLFNVKWNISVKGGFLGGVDEFNSGFIDRLDDTKSVTIGTKEDEISLNLGPVEIMVSVEADGKKYVFEADGFVIGSIIVLFA